MIKILNTSKTVFGNILKQCCTFLCAVILKLGIIISYVVSGAANIVYPFIKANYRNNSRFLFYDFIYDQEWGDAANLLMGYYKASYNGCGWIATYNASRLLNKHEQPAEIIKYYDSRGGTLFVGALGVNPLSVKQYFQKTGNKARFYGLPFQHDALTASAKVAILTYFHQKGAHIVAIQYDNGAFHVFNDANTTAPLKISSIDTWLKANSYLSISLVCL